MPRVPGLGAVLEDGGCEERSAWGQPTETRAESPRPAQVLPWVESAHGTQWERVINQGGAGKGSFQRGKNEGHWARAQERPPLYSRAGRGAGSQSGFGGEAGRVRGVCCAGLGGAGKATGWAGAGRACGLQEGAGHLRASGLTLCRPQPAFLLLQELREFLEDGHTAAGVQSL